MRSNLAKKKVEVLVQQYNFRPYNTTEKDLLQKIEFRVSYVFLGTLYNSSLDEAKYKVSPRNLCSVTWTPGSPGGFVSRNPCLSKIVIIMYIIKRPEELAFCDVGP